MERAVKPGKRNGAITIPASKSYPHRLLIGASLGNKETVLDCEGISKDIEATIKCLNALGAKIEYNDNRNIRINKTVGKNREEADMFCGESGSTLRFLIPVVGALGRNAVFHMEGKLSERPLDALTNELIAHGMNISKDDKLLKCQGRLKAGDYTIPGDISSQYVSGLLFALPILEGDSTLRVTGKIESAGYIKMTEDVLASMGILFEKKENLYTIPGNQTFCTPDKLTVEKDWSNAAFFLCMGAQSEKGITLRGMNMNSAQGDIAIVEILKNFGARVSVEGDNITVSKGTLLGITVDASTIPDLVPTISALASLADGETRIINAERLRFKESDRLLSTSELLINVGANVTKLDDGLIIHGQNKLSGGTADAMNDHRIAMSAAVTACSAKDVILIKGAECVAKSYPDFWKDFDSLEVEG